MNISHFNFLYLNKSITMKKLLLVLLFVPLISFGQQPIKVEVKSTVKTEKSFSEMMNDGANARAAATTAAAAATTAAAARATAKKNETTEIIIPLETDLYNYTHIAMVDMNHVYMGRKKASYNWFEKEVLTLSPLTIVNPTSDRKKFKKNPLYLRDTKNSKWVYLYLTNMTGDKIDYRTTVILRDYKNKILYRAKHTNVLLPEILEFLTVF